MSDNIKNTEFEIFPWQKNFDTGIEIIDNQHKKLVDILNLLASNLANRSKPFLASSKLVCIEPISVLLRSLVKPKSNSDNKCG